jgi:Ca-activated chloride channel family protein
VSGQTVDVPVRPADLEMVAETTGRRCSWHQTGDELANAYSSIQSSLGETLGEEIQIVKNSRGPGRSSLLLSVAWRSACSSAAV